jgi:hypothetical protein
MISYSNNDVYHERLFNAIVSISKNYNIDIGRNLNLIEEFELHFSNINGYKMNEELYNIILNIYNLKKYGFNTKNITIDIIQEGLLKKYINDIHKNNSIISKTLADILEMLFSLIYGSFSIINSQIIEKYCININEFYEILKIIEKIFDWKIIHNSPLILFENTKFNIKEEEELLLYYDANETGDTRFYYGSIYSDDCYNSATFIDNLRDIIYNYKDKIVVKYEYWYYNIIITCLNKLYSNYFTIGLNNNKILINKTNNINGLFRYYILCMKKTHALFDFKDFENILCLSILVKIKKWINVPISKYILYCTYPEYKNLIDILEIIVYNNYDMVIHMLFKGVVKFL